MREELVGFNCNREKSIRQSGLTTMNDVVLVNRQYVKGSINMSSFGGYEMEIIKRKGD